MSTNRIKLTSLRSVTSQIHEKVFNRATKRAETLPPADHESALREAKPSQQDSQRPDWYQATHRSDS